MDSPTRIGTTQKRKTKLDSVTHNESFKRKKARREAQPMKETLMENPEQDLPKTRKKPKSSVNALELLDVEDVVPTDVKMKRTFDDGFMDVEEIVPTLAKKKRRRKKNKTQALAENKTVVEPNIEFTDALNSFIKDKLSTLEKEDFEIPSSVIHVMKLSQDDIVDCFQRSLPKCLQVLKRNIKVPGCPLALILAGSAMRAIELKRKFQILSEDVLIAKLFAKHMKIKDQVSFLEKNVIKMAVGTPKRISELLDLDALSLRSLRYIILDWTWRDSKLRRLTDMPELKCGWTLSRINLGVDKQAARACHEVVNSTFEHFDLDASSDLSEINSTLRSMA